MFEALSVAARAQLRPRMLGLVLLPLLGALLLWIVLYVAVWHQLVEGLRQLIAAGASEQWLSQGVAGFLSDWIVLIAMLLFLLPLTQATALIVTATVAMPIMVEDIARREFPQLERRHGGSVVGSIVNAFAALLIYLALWVLTLPLWLLGIPAIVLPLLLNAYLNARLFRYDALAEHASADEYSRIMSSARGPLFGLGIAAALLQMVPVVNLFSPVYSGLSFIYFGFGELARMRALERTSA
jgi:uncharacterized protein involved in cysteine biosynthesis